MKWDKEEQKRLETLLKQTQDWGRAQEIRAYIMAVSSSEQSGKDGGVDEVGTQEWHQWASQQAARLDPLMERPPSVLDENISPYW